MPTARSSGGSATSRPVSTSVVSPATMTPCFGFSSPAMARSTEVLPAPEGPTSASVSRAQREPDVQVELA